MAREIPFPTDRSNLQIFKLQVGPWKNNLNDLPDRAIAKGVFLSPRRNRNAKDQEFLILRGSLARKTQGDSDQPAAIAARDRIRGRGALEDLGGMFDRLTADVAFPSLSRAASFLCGRAENGWKIWKLDDSTRPWTVSDAYDYDEQGKFDLIYYEAAPGLIWIPK